MPLNHQRTTNLLTEKCSLKMKTISIWFLWHNFIKCICVRCESLLNALHMSVYIKSRSRLLIVKLHLCSVSASTQSEILL